MKTKLNQSALKGAIVSAMLLGTATLIAPAYATEQTANLNVSANINMSCTITTTNLAFGNYDPIVTNLSDPLNKMASVTSTCTVGSAGVITLDNGDHYDEGLGRRMAHATEAGNYLTYSVSNASYGGANWGLGSEAVAYMGTGSAVEEDVYGSVAANQFTAEDGSYTDTIIASINY